MRYESEDQEIICIRKLTPICRCPICTGKPKPGRPKAVEFPELIEAMVRRKHEQGSSKDEPYKEAEEREGGEETAKGEGQEEKAEGQGRTEEGGRRG